MIEAIFATITIFVIKTISTLGYWGIIFLMTVESTCIPLPSEIIMPFAGYLTISARFSLLGVTLAGAFGCLLGSIIAYCLGYWGGRSWLEKYGKYLLLSKHDIGLADKFFNKYGPGVVFFSRLLPAIRTFISLPAGIARMNFTKFISYSFLGSLPWCFALAWVGKFFGENWNILSPFFHEFDFVLLILLVIFIIWYIIRRKKLKNNL